MSRPVCALSILSDHEAYLSLKSTVTDASEFQLDTQMQLNSDRRPVARKSERSGEAANRRSVACSVLAVWRGRGKLNLRRIFGIRSKMALNDAADDDPGASWHEKEGRPVIEWSCHCAGPLWSPVAKEIRPERVQPERESQLEKRRKCQKLIDWSIIGNCFLA